MITACILLDQNDNYVYPDGKLPMRPKWDKRLLGTFIEKGSVSFKGYNLLPPSLKNLAKITPGEPVTPITIPEIAGLADILVVSRSKEMRQGKRFRLDAFEQILSEGKLEIWRRK